MDKIKILNHYHSIKPVIISLLDCCLKYYFLHFSYSWHRWTLKLCFVKNILPTWQLLKVWILLIKRFQSYIAAIPLPLLSTLCPYCGYIYCGLQSVYKSRKSNKKKCCLYQLIRYFPLLYSLLYCRTFAVMSTTYIW